MTKPKADIVKFNELLRRELRGLGVAFDRDEVWEAMERISEAALAYAAAFHKDVVNK